MLLLFFPTGYVFMYPKKLFLKIKLKKKETSKVNPIYLSISTRHVYLHTYHIDMFSGLARGTVNTYIHESCFIFKNISDYTYKYT